MKKILSILLIAVIILSLFSGCRNTHERANYNIEIKYSENEHELTIKQKVTLKNSTKTQISSIFFNVPSNAYREGAKLPPVPREKEYLAYPYGKTNGAFMLENVTDSNGRTLTHKLGGHDSTLLEINLGKPLLQNKKVSITLDYKVKLSNIRHRLGYSEISTTLGNFYPILAPIIDGKPYETHYYSKGDPFVSDYADYNVSITLPSDYIVSSSGKLSKKLTEQNLTTSSYKLSNAIDFAISFSKKYKILEGEFQNIKVYYYYYVDDTPKKSLQTAIDSLSTFTKLFGKYPYPTFSVSQVPFIYGGMEYPANVFISDSLKNDYYTETIIHETAHQWWYGVVSVNQLEDAFIDEGLAQLSLMLFYENNPSYGVTKEKFSSDLKKSMESYKEICSLVGKKLDSTIKRPLKDFKSEFEYNFNTYVLSLMMFDELRTVMGEEKFMLALKSLYSENIFSRIDEKNIITAFNKFLSYDISPIIQAYLNGKMFFSK